MRIAVVGGGAAGVFAAIACGEACPAAEVTVFEATDHPLAKVRVSGGGRCNVTHACFEPGELAQNYPRGSRELLGPLHRFGPREIFAWFAGRGVELKTEGDGRVFPVTDNSGTIVDCLLEGARRAGVCLRKRCGVASLSGRRGAFVVRLTTGETASADRVLIATGGNSRSGGLAMAAALGHAIVPPVPSLFTFHVDDPRLKGLEGLSVSFAEASVRGARLAAAGPVLVTHWGLSGPAILRLSAWGARELHAAGYRFTLGLNWAAPRTIDEAEAVLAAGRLDHPRRGVAATNPFGLPLRLWERLCAAAGVPAETVWAGISKAALRALAAQTAAGDFRVTGKSMYKEEFVTCGGVRLNQVNFATMESRICPGVYFAGEVLDIDGITGGFNFQAAWTTGWHAGRAMSLPNIQAR
ncbi:MAG: NAD(P)/FAD-dependent oxidoreductase [Opitutaceae bacterium]|jgi:predicted Rossmann fold flavoprotein